MSDDKEFTACVIVIGNEILSGRTQDKNLAYIAKGLNEAGVRLAEARVIPDIRETVIETVNHCRAHYDYVFTTGGIGPTHDDITSECVAQAFGVGMFRDPATVDEMTRRVEARGETMNEARLRMATFPEGASLLANSISVAPGYRLGNVFVMAGIPRVMRVMFEEALPQLEGGRRMKALGVAIDLGEGTIAEGLALLQARYREIDIGSYPQMGGGGFRVSLVLRGTDDALLDRARDELLVILRDLGGNPVEEDPELSQGAPEPETT